MGVHSPMFAPHATTCGDGVSIAMAVTFRTRACERRMMIHGLNHRLRKHGRRPQPFGTGVADEVKYRGMQAYRRLRSVTRQ
jgi:hypothetical protein